jgi:hypothetical protein
LKEKSAMKLKHLAAPALAFGAIVQAQAAQAQQACIAPADVGDMVVYTLPIAYDAARTACAGQFTQGGFIARDGARFIGPFRAKQNTSWPGAFRGMKMFMARQGTNGRMGGMDMGGLLNTLPEGSIRPVADGIVGQMIAKEIKPKDCGKIERGMELLSPLPTENVGALFSFIAELVDLRSLEICAADPAKPKK